MNLRNALKLLAASAALLGGVGLLTACSQKKEEEATALAFSAIDVTGAQYARQFELPDHNGQVRHLQDFAGKVVVMFFGYTQCPDVCPTTMNELAEVKRALGKDGERVQGLFVTVDPARDTPEVLKAYMTAFDPSFLALITTPETLAQVTKEYKIYYKRVDGSAPNTYTMDHSAGSYIYDTKGQLRLFTSYGSGVAALTSDIKILLNRP